MSSDRVAIRVSDLSKCYQIYDKPRDRLKQFLLPRLQQVLKRNRKKYFQEFMALQDVSFEVLKGETVGIIGVNGSGKSTLLQAICGTLSPTKGSIDIDGRVAALLELGSGFNPEFTGRENVYLNAAVLGLKQEEIDARFDDIQAFADIGQFVEQPVKTYSSGMIVRLAFAVIAHVDADILIIDEALSVGDAFFVQKCMRFLRGFMKKGTVLFVSHDTGAVLNLCSQAVWLVGGKVKMIGSPKEVSEGYLASLHEITSNEQDRALEDKTAETDDSEEAVIRDMRLDYINKTNLRNDIELFKFDEDGPSFGNGAATITNVYLTNKAGDNLSWVVGGEEVVLTIVGIANDILYSPIMGFSVKDRLGQVLFGDNTFLVYRLCPISVHKGQYFKADFKFYMPILPVGDYVVNAAIAEGSQEDHVQLHWVHDALTFRSHSSSVAQGLVGVPMKSISLSTN
jgi:lipopolysaccharide transport system ATP-binding protein